MFTQPPKKPSSSSSIPTFKQALNKPSSIPTRGVRASSNKENIAPSSAMPALKRSSVTSKSQVKNVEADVVQKRSSCYRVTNDPHDQSELAECSSLFVEPTDSIRLDFEEPTLSSTPRKRRAEMIAKWSALAAQGSAAPLVFESKQSESTSAMDDTFDLSGNCADMEILLDTALPAEIVANENLLDATPPAGIVANDSLVLTRKRLAANAARIEDDGDESVCSEDSVIIEGNGSFELSQELATSAERLMDVSLTSLMDVEIDYSLEFPTGALGRAPHIFVAKYKRDMKRKAAAEEALRKEVEKKNAIPSLMVTSPSSGDLCFDNGAELEFEIEDIMNQSFRDHLLDGSWHNWNMRFNFENVLLELAESEASSYDENEVY